MSYSEETLRSKFDVVEETQESIVTTSQWILFHHRYVERTAVTWAKYLAECDVKKKISLVYIANEVIQQARSKRKMEVVDAFAKVLPEAVKKCHESVPGKIQEKLVKIVKIWRDRRIFSKDIEIIGIKCPGSVPSSRPANGVKNAVNGYERIASPVPQSKDNAQISPNKPQTNGVTTQVKEISILQKYQQTYQEILVASEGTLTEAQLPQLESLATDIKQQVTELTSLLTKIQGEITTITGVSEQTPVSALSSLAGLTASSTSSDSNPLALLQSLQQPTPTSDASNPLALLQSITTSTSSTIQPLPELEDDEEDGYTPAESTASPATANQSSELLRRIEELKQLEQLKSLAGLTNLIPQNQSPAQFPPHPLAALQQLQQQQQQLTQPQDDDDEMLPTYDSNDSDSEDEEKLPETFVREVTPIHAREASNETEGAAEVDDNGRPRKRLRFAL